MSRAITEDEARANFLEHVLIMVQYWDKVDGKTKLEALSGLAFSILVAIDGGSMDLPAFDLVPSPHPDDEAYAKDEGDNWYVPKAINASAQMHEEFCALEKKRGVR
jgi:hypothetical protein